MKLWPLACPARASLPLDLPASDKVTDGAVREGWDASLTKPMTPFVEGQVSYVQLPTVLPPWFHAHADEVPLAIDVDEVAVTDGPFQDY